MSRRTAALSCLLLIPVFLGADVTLRYQVDYKANPSLPPAFSDEMNTRLTPPASGAIILIKGGKVRAAVSGFTSITDVPNNTMTLLDPARRHFATIAASQFASEAMGAMPKMPGTFQGILSSLKMTVDSRGTGRTAEIMGIRTDEREVVLSLGMPVPSGATPLPVMNFVMQYWLAKPEEVNRNPALRELVASGIQQLSGANPAEWLHQLFAPFPGMGDSLSSVTKEIADAHTVALRTHTELFTRVFAMMAQRMPAANNPFAAVDQDAPLLTMDQEVAELSTSAVAESAFQIPADYTAVPLSEILAANMPKSATQPVPVAITPAPAPADVYSIGNGVTVPSVLQKVDPVYTDEARANKINGTVTLSVIVGTDGKPLNIHVVRSLDAGLDQKAIDAVEQWVFSPGKRNGVPVNVRAQIEVSFRTLDRPDPQN
jgi:TonB family protein